MKGILVFVLFFSVFNVRAEFVKGEGKFWVADGDSYEFIKSQLIYEGFVDIISKEIERMGLNKDIFWGKFQDRLTERNLEIEEQLKKELNITEKSSATEINNFKKRLRLKKLKYREKFGSLYSVVPKWVVKKISRSASNSNLRYISIEGKVDNSKLSKLYYGYVRGAKNSEYGTLYINVEYQLERFSFSDLGIENEKDFSGVINKNWVEWFEKNKPQNIANIELLSDYNKTKLESYLKLPNKEMKANVPDMFINSLLLDIKVELVRSYFNNETNEFRFKFKGAAYLRDLQSNLIVDTYEFSEKDKSYHIKKDISLANLVANETYQLVKNKFLGVQRDIKELTEINNSVQLHLIRYPNIGAIKSFIDLIESRGIKLSLNANLDNVLKSRSIVSVNYDGELSDLKTLLSSLQSAKKDLPFDVIENGDILGIKFSRENNLSL